MSRGIPTAVVHKQTVIERLSKGEQLPTIAKDLGITASAISHALSKDTDYIDAIVLQLDVRMRQREEEVESATDMFSLARAKELLRHSEFRASTEARSRWGNKDIPVININTGNQVDTILAEKITDILKAIDHQA